MKPSQRKIEVKCEWLAIKKSESGRANINEIETKLKIKYKCTYTLDIISRISVVIYTDGCEDLLPRHNFLCLLGTLVLMEYSRNLARP